ncbi:nuclear transport factor 2 family protein [Sphingobacterium shayense]|uniref:nuclear transport factor 2 family protein n=1 Tax=Sphingobacterium shayense TaxID=626343 RepID=UPI00155500C1|nr:nuclear transport factor 2 family protein [Sphingobacterium shayense]NQD70962.1 nuclear transport factor 2 family protein [Sphingobacterium shayense]
MENEILKLEEQLVAAIQESDLKILDLLLHDDLIFVNHMGMVLSKTEDLAPHISGDLKITGLIASDQRLHQFGDTSTVVVTKDIKGVYLSQPFESRVKFTRVWKLFNGGWKVITVSSVSC